MTHSPPRAPTDLSESIATQLLQTVAVDPARATRTQVMQALAQVARAELSRRWVRTQTRERDARARAGCITCRWNF